MVAMKKYIPYIATLLFAINTNSYAQSPLANITFIILGASGDLASRDLIPALFRLYRDKQLESFAVIGAALPLIDTNDMYNQSQQFVHDYNQQEWDAFKQHLYYVSVDFTQQEQFEQLNMLIQHAEQQHNLSGNRLIYCATSCDFFIPITKALVHMGIMTKQSPEHIQPWHRIVYEKPFGYDLSTAKNIENCSHALLHTTQVFHMDHFLMTQTMHHIPALRFSNRMWEDHWNKNYIRKIDILCNETLSVGTRGKFYDAVGSLLDVVQNHMFQMLALIAMEEPSLDDAASIQHARAAVINNTHLVDGFLGQYNGYTQEQNIPADSTTDTFSALHFAIDTPRWHGVPFYLITGKCLDETEICIRITFTSDDQLTLWIAPQPKIELTLHTADEKALPLNLIYNYPIKDSYSTDTYKNILSALCTNNQYTHVACEEIEAAWNLIAEIKQKNLPFYKYEQKSNGPIALKLFNTLLP